MASPEEQARETIDRMLTKSGWAVRDQGDAHISAYRGLAIRNFTLKQGHGFADYMLYVDGRAAGVVEAKKEGKIVIYGQVGPELRVALTKAFKDELGLDLELVPGKGNEIATRFLTET